MPIVNLSFHFIYFNVVKKEICKSITANGGDKGKLVEKGPVMLLYELFNDLKFECLSDDGFAHSKFRMIVTINNQNFDGTGEFVDICLYSNCEQKSS
jgi:hypothetical protein